MGLGNLLKRLLGQPDRVRAVKFIGEGVRRARDGDLEMALYFYRKAKRADEDYALSHLNIGLALQDQYNREREGLGEDERLVRLVQVASALDRAIELDPELATAFSARGYVRRALGHLGDAAADLERFFELAPEDEPRREAIAKDLAELKEQADKLAQRQEVLARVQDPVAEPEQLVEAKAELTRMLGVTLDDAELWWALGVAQRRSGEIEESRTSFSRAIELDPNHTEAQRELASLAFRDRDFEVALDHARRAYALDPTHAAVVCNVGVCYLELGRLEEAEEHIELARRLDPEDPIVKVCLEDLAKAKRGERLPASSPDTAESFDPEEPA